ncbi:MAG: glutaredoxin 3, partial [Pseudomonadota bacterium]
MALIEIYTKWDCPYCTRAKALFNNKGVEFQEFDVSMGGAPRAEMVARAPEARTVPQIFINGIGIGG